MPQGLHFASALSENRSAFCGPTPQRAEGDADLPDPDTLFNAFVTILTTIEPPGLAPLFLALTRGMTAGERRQVSLRGSVIAFAILALFGMAGAGILGVLGITLPAFRVAGGLLLFFIAFEMVFEKRQDRKEKSADTAVTRDHIRDVAAFPLAMPLIAGPGAISATVLISGSLPGVAGKASLLAILALCVAITFAVLLLAQQVDRLLGQTGRSILTRLLGVLLAALAVQFVADGVRALAGA